MIRRGHSGKIDANQPDIVKHLRAIGCSVQSLATVGDGCPDILVGLQGLNIVLEIKDPSQIPSKRRMTEPEETWHLGWKGQKAVVETAKEAEKAIWRHVQTHQAHAPTPVVDRIVRGRRLDQYAQRSLRELVNELATLHPHDFNSTEIALLHAEMAYSATEIEPERWSDLIRDRWNAWNVVYTRSPKARPTLQKWFADGTFGRMPPA